MKKFIYTRHIIVIGVLLFSLGCSTQKNTWLNRNYHSITTKYNGYFNARESYREGLKRLHDVHEDNYEDVLSIFRYGSEQQTASVAGNMDIAYQKASTAIRRHSMNIRGVEYNRWIDDSYYLIARSHYFKGDHNLAILTFQYVVRQFETPLKYKSKIWVAKTHIKTGQYNNAFQLLERVNRNLEEGLLDRDAKLLYYKVYADYYLQQREFGQAASFLEKAALQARRRKDQTRMTFILAQCYHQNRNYAKAQETYGKVLKLNPDFDMAFQARINMAMAYDTESGDSRFVLSELKGMLRSSKNREYQDQIYYALAQFSMRQSKENQAIEYYKESLEHYRGNDSQKGITFLRLGEIHFKNKNYVKAAQMYDSTMVYLSDEYPDFNKAGKQNMLLKELAINIKMVEREDSLQRLAAMSTSERNAILDQIIEEIQEQERLERELEQERARMRQQMARQGRGQTPGGGDGGWYFYNPTAISHGRNEFYAKWGERELEDLWRISNKQVMAFGDMGDFDMMDGEPEQEGGRVTRASLMENVPTTPEKMQASNQRMAQAYYNKGMIFKDRLEDIPSAISAFEKVLTEFSENDHKLYSAYFLYTLFKQQGNDMQANRYKNLIIDEFPDTDFARILADPSYRENIMARQNQIKNLYKAAYQAYLAGNYDKAMELYSQSKMDTVDVSHEQAAQFSFLKALILVKSEKSQESLDQLTYITEQYTETRVHEPATNLLAFLGAGGLGETEIAEGRERHAGQRTTETDEKRVTAESSIFSFNPDAVHFYVMVVNTQSLEVRQLRNDVNVFNREEFADSNLNMSTLFFDQNQQLVTITNFKDAATAMQYGNQMINALIEKEYDSSTFNGFAISVDNYPVFYQERKLEEYLEFFEILYSDIR